MITALYHTFLAFAFSTEALSTQRDFLGAPLYMSGEEARALAKSSGSLHTRDQTQCQSVSINDLLSSLGEALQEIENIATNLWGGDWNTVTTNPSQFLDSPAQGCYPTDNEFNVIWDTPTNNQSCPISAAQFFGDANGTSSSTLQIYQGTSVTLMTTVATTVTFMLGVEYRLKIVTQFPLFKAKDYYTVSVSVAIDNTHSSTTMTTQDSRVIVHETMHCEGPAEVEIDVALRQCTVNGHIDIPVTVSGWVWFFYPTKRSGHWDWAINFDSIDMSKRQSNMSVSVSGDSTSYGEFLATCGCAFP